MSHKLTNSLNFYIKVPGTRRTPGTGAVPEQDPDADEGDGHQAARRHPRLDHQEAVWQQHHGGQVYWMGTNQKEMSILTCGNNVINRNVHLMI